MPLVKQGHVAEDPYLAVLDDSPIPNEGAVLVTAARFLADAAEITQRSGPTGVVWPNARNIAELAPWIHRLSLVALAFPTFKDGRAYSQARILRERHHFRGELRATGQVLRDQFLFLHRAGFDAFNVAKEADIPAFLDALKRYSVFYQPAADGQPSAFRRRTAAHAAPLQAAKQNAR